MPLLTDMKAYLVAQGVTDTIFIGHMPDKPDAAVALYEYAGLPIDPDVDIESPGLQIKVRGPVSETDYTDTRARAETLLRKLHGKKNIAISGRRYIQILARQSPMGMPRDENNRPSFVINFIVRKDMD